MNKKAIAGLLGAASLVTLAACNNNKANNAGGESAAKASERKFPTEVTNEGTPIKGGTINYAIVSASPFKGLIQPLLSVDNSDGALEDFAFANLFEYDENQRIKKDGGMMEFTLDRENKTVTLKLRSKDYKWSDGQPLTIDDYIFTYEFIGNKDYNGVRYDENAANIVGMEEFHDGKADKISGLEKVDDQTVKIHLKEVYPALELGGNAIMGNIMPKHIFKDMTYDQAVASDAARTKVVGNGPFIVDKVVPGESVTFKKNPYYYKGEPKVDGVKADIVSPDSIVQEMKAGKYDIASMPSAQYDSFKDLTNVTFVSSLQSQYEYIGFKLGKWDKEQGKNIVDPNAKMSDVALRQAIAYAIDPDTAGKNLYNGLQHGTNSIIIPFFKDIYNKDQEGFAYNPEKAKKLLEDAGYKDVDGDGLRENKDGSKLKINFAARTRDDANESLIQQYLLWWKEVGLDVQLYTGRTLEVNNFYDKVEADDPEIDMFAAGWATGYDPNPSGLFGEDAKFNMQRFTTPEGNALIEKISSNEAFDDAKNIQFYKEWQKYVHDQAFIFPTLTGESVTAVNKRVKYYDKKIGSNHDESSMIKLQLTANEPVK